MYGRARTLTEVNIRARWVEASCIRLKREGNSFREIARQLTAAGRGDYTILDRLPEPEGFAFPPNYRISMKACHKAFRKALYRLPNEEAAGWRELELHRCEAMYRKLEPAIARGEMAAIEAALRIMEHKAELLGCTPGSPSR